MNEHSLEPLWEDAERAQQTQELVIRRLTGESGLGNFVGVEGQPSRRLMVLELGLDPSRMRTIPSWNVVAISYVQGPEFRTSIQVKLNDNGFKAHFSRLATDLHVRTHSVNSALQKQDAITKTLREWKAFVENQRTTMLTDEEERGLVAEVEFLIRYLVPALGARRAVEAWHGPQGMRHDFRFETVHGRRAVEIKSNTVEKPSVRISSPYQLDDDGLDKLWLYVMTLKPSDRDGETLPEIAARLLEAMPTEDLKATATKLLGQGGYAEHDAEKYVRKFVFSVESAYAVQDGFPRVVRPTEGVEDVRYAVNLANAAPFRCRTTAVIEGIQDVN